MGHPMRTELTRADLLVYLANHYTIRGAQPIDDSGNKSVFQLPSRPFFKTYTRNIFNRWKKDFIVPEIVAYHSLTPKFNLICSLSVTNWLAFLKFQLLCNRFSYLPREYSWLTIWCPSQGVGQQLLHYTDPVECVCFFCVNRCGHILQLHEALHTLYYHLIPPPPVINQMLPNEIKWVYPRCKTLK